MYIHDDTIKQLIHRYQIARSQELFLEIREALSHYIYHYPRKVFRADHDAAMDFYTDVLENLDRTLLQFEAKDYRFLTWFTVVLRNSYLNYARNKKKKTKRSLSSISFERIISRNKGKELRLEEIIQKTEGSPSTDERYLKIIKRLEAALDSSFSERDSLVFKIHYLEIFQANILTAIKQHFKVDIKKAIAIYEAAKASYIDKYSRALKLQDLILSTSERIRRYEKEGKQKKARALKKNRDRYISYYHGIKIVVPYKHLANLFNSSVNAVTKVIQKIKQFFKKSALAKEFG